MADKGLSQSYYEEEKHDHSQAGKLLALFAINHSYC